MDFDDESKDKRTRTVWCIRHGQSAYNQRVRSASTWLSSSFWSNGFDPLIRDPELSDTGRTQCDLLRTRLNHVSFLTSAQIGAVFVSPLRRALDTALESLGRLDIPIKPTDPPDQLEVQTSEEDFKDDSKSDPGISTPRVPDESTAVDLSALSDFSIPFIAHHLLREWMDTLGDVGSNRSDLQQTAGYCGDLVVKSDDTVMDPSVISLPSASASSLARDIATSVIAETAKVPCIDFSYITEDVWWLPDPDSDLYETSKKCDHISAETGRIVGKESQVEVHQRIDQFKNWLIYDYCKKQSSEDDCDNIVIVGHSRWLREMVRAKKKLDNCGMMKVKMIGTEVESFEVIEFDKAGLWKSKLKKTE